jgi:hypothetical protein
MSYRAYSVVAADGSLEPRIIVGTFVAPTVITIPDHYSDVSITVGPEPTAVVDHRPHRALVLVKP